jgi:hypothetical protein
VYFITYIEKKNTKKNIYTPFEMSDPIEIPSARNAELREFYGPSPTELPSEEDGERMSDGPSPCERRDDDEEDEMDPIQGLELFQSLPRRSRSIFSRSPSPEASPPTLVGMLKEQNRKRSLIFTFSPVLNPNSKGGEEVDLSTPLDFTLD